MNGVDKRRTQQERTAVMRARLLDATLELIIEEGWSNTSTQKICQRAGVSRGAQTHHFPTRESLLIASVREIVNRHQRHIDAKLEQSETRFTLEDFFEFLWDATFNDDLLTIWVEAMVAARTDPALAAVARDTDQTAITAMKGIAGRSMSTMPCVADDSGATVADLIELTIYLLRGMVVQAGVHRGDAEDRRRLFEVWRRLIGPRLSGFP